MCPVFSSCLRLLVLICFHNPNVRFLDFSIKRISLFLTSISCCFFVAVFCLFLFFLILLKEGVWVFG